MNTSRRQFIRNASTASLSLYTGSSIAAAQETTSSPLPSINSKATPQNLIFLVADGMNHGTLALADIYSKEFFKQPSQWTRLYREKALTRSLMETASASSYVTDSAAAGSSWGGGKRVHNGAINTNPDKSKNTPLWLFAKDKSKATGLVTTTRVTHATPASFASAVPKRSMEAEIAEQLLSNEIDVILGGGNRFFSREKRSDGKDLWAQFAKNGYKTVHNKAELSATAKDAGRLFGIFHDSHLPYTIDQIHNEDIAKTVPTLAEMMTVALDRLVPNENGFVLQVEGGRIDHAGHGNDPGAILHDQLAFDACIAVARQFVKEHPNTLVILTTDHGTGGCHVNGMGSAYNDTPALFSNLQHISSSFEYLGNQFSAWPPSVEEVQKVLKQGTSFEFSKDRIKNALANAKSDSKRDIANQLSKLLVAETSIGWTTNNHTGEAVEFCAFGPGSQNIPHFFENWQLHHMLKKAMAI